MKILFCESVNINNPNSFQVHIYEVFHNLSKFGHNVVPIKIDNSGEKGDTASQAKLLPHIKDLLRSSFIYKRFKGEITLSLMLFSEMCHFISILKLLMQSAGKFDVIYRRYNLLNSEYLLAKLMNIPFITEVNGIFSDEAIILNIGDKFTLNLIKRIECYTLRRANKIIVVTPKMKDILQQDYRISKQKIVVIENGVNIDLFKPINYDTRVSLRLDPSYLYVGFVGSFNEWHGLDDLVKCALLVCPQIPKARFVLVGDGRLKASIIDMVDKLGLKNQFIFTGEVPYKLVPLYVNAFDICVSPKKKGIVGAPLKLCEYMSCNKPVIATKSDDFQFIEDINAGILINPEDSEQFAEAIVKLLQDKELRQHMGDNGRIYVLKYRSWEKVAQRVSNVCENTIKEYKLNGKLT